MCLAVIGKILKIDKSNAISDVDGNIVTINIQLTPDVHKNDYVLIHAGFSIETMPKQEFFETQELLNKISRIVHHVQP